MIGLDCHASLKSKNKQKVITHLCKDDGTNIFEQEDMEREILDFYGQLMGNAQPVMEGIDIEAMRYGNNLERDQRCMLNNPVTEKEVLQALKSLGDLKAPDPDGYGAKFFKSSWNIVREDMMEIVKLFFEKGELDSRINTTLITLIPKHSQATNLRDFRPISCCSTVYNILSKVMACRISKVLSSVISKNQVAFIPGQKIQDHVLLAYEIITCYNRKGGAARCRLQMDIKKAYDSVE